MSSKPAPIKAGNKQGQRKFANDSDSMAIADAGRRVRPTGPGQQPGADSTRQEEDPGQGQGLTYWDREAWWGQENDAAKDQAMKDYLSLYPNADLGSIVAGSGQADGSVVDYFGEKRDRRQIEQLENLALASYDPYDPRQKQMLQQRIPGIVESKRRDFERCVEQKAFIHRCADATTEGISNADWQRLVRIIGGGERFLVHPIDRTWAKAVLGGQGVNSIGNSLAELFRGLLEFKTPEKARYDIIAENNRTRDARREIAGICLQHFPRFMTGAYLNESQVEYRKRVLNAAAALTEACERVVDSRKTIGEVATEIIAQSNLDTPFTMAPSWARVRGAEGQWGGGPLVGPAVARP